MTQDLITSPFTASSTAAEVVPGIDLRDKRAIVTGGSSGIGIETARALGSAGADATLAVRNPDAGARAGAEINDSLDGERVTVARLDLIDLGSVRNFAQQRGSTPLHVLVNNACIMAAPLDRSPTGWESQLATNHLGHFALATAPHDALAAATNARIVSVSSRAHLCSPVDLDDINFNRRDYDPWLGYGQSKTANVLFAVEATRRWADDGITTNALHPGSIWTNLVRYLTDDVRDSLRTDPTGEYKTPEQGAATSVFVGTSPLVDGIGGRYFEDSNQGVPYLGGPERVGVATTPTMPSTPTPPNGSSSSPHTSSADPISHSLPVTR